MKYKDFYTTVAYQTTWTYQNMQGVLKAQESEQCYKSSCFSKEKRTLNMIGTWNFSKYDIQQQLRKQGLCQHDAVACSTRRQQCKEESL